jgi:hypothetical protein
MYVVPEWNILQMYNLIRGKIDIETFMPISLLVMIYAYIYNLFI